MNPNEELDKEEKKLYYQFKLAELNRKVWEMDFEVRFQKRIQLIDINRKLTFGNQQVGITEYIAMLQKDINNVKSRIEVLKTILEELNFMPTIKNR